MIPVDAVTGAHSSSGYPTNFYVDSTGRPHSAVVGALSGFTSAAKGAVSRAKDAVAGVVDSFSGSPGVDTVGMYNYYDPNGASPSSADFSLPEYPNAALSSLYGMDQETAYQEALSNTAIQRRMQDYKAAGLNPVLAARYNSGAESFSGSVAYPLSFGASQGSTPSGSASGASYGGSSGKSVLGSGLGRVLKNSDYRSAIAALASAGTMAATKSFPLGAAAYYGVKGLLNSFSRK